MENRWTIDPDYVAVWRHMLVGWLGWTEGRLMAFVRGWEDWNNRQPAEVRDSWHHDDEFAYVLRLLVPEALATRLERQHTGRRPNDFEALSDELRSAITGRPHRFEYQSDAFDWEGARNRAESVLGRFGVGFPSSMEVGAYEKRIVGGG